MLNSLMMFFFVASIICFTLQRKTILSALLSLEAMILSCLVQIIFLSESAPSLAIFILMIAACESAFGLTILVLISRSEETDKLFFLKS